jgi:hypothetical protein
VKSARLQLRCDARLKEQAERLARRRHTTLSAMVTRYIQHELEADHLERHVGGKGEAEQI